MKILVIAGEASADLHAGHVVERLKQKAEVSLIGVGGDHLIRQGLQPLRHAREMAVVGFTEAIRRIPDTLRLLNELERLAEKEKPDFALLLDLPDFNLRLAPKLKKLGIPVVYYISPQVWAWRSGRVQQMADVIDLLLTILPFEKPWYEQNAPKRLSVEYVGHPVLEEIEELPYAPEVNRLVIMPGSRESEWRNLFGTMVAAAALLHRAKPELRFEIPIAEPLRTSALVREYLSESGPFGDSILSLGVSLKAREVPAHECLRKAQAAWIASGTATLEAAVVGTPMVVAYRVSALTAFLFQHLIRYRGPVAMVNLIHCGIDSSERVVPELLQNEVNPFSLASGMRGILSEPAWSQQVHQLAQTRALLAGAGKPIDNAAQTIRKFLEDRK